jgi:hypothetical protein
MKNPKTTIAGILALIFSIGPILYPKYTAVFTALAGLAAALGLAVARDGGTGSQAPNGPMDNNLATSAAPVPIDPQKPAPIGRLTDSGVVR